MNALGVLVSRLVPLLLLWGVVLILGRWLHDRLVPRGRAPARAVFAGILFLGAVASSLPLLRAGTLAAATWASDHHRLGATVRWYESYWRLGGTPAAGAAVDWAFALANLQVWTPIPEVLESAFETRRDGVYGAPSAFLLRGIARYHLGEVDAALQDLASLGDGPDSFLRDYYLARLAERRGEVEVAIALYARSFRTRPVFAPAAYQLVRLHLRDGRPADAARVARRLESVGGGPGAVPDELRPLLLGDPPYPSIPDREFRFVHG